MHFSTKPDANIFTTIRRNLSMNVSSSFDVFQLYASTEFICCASIVKNMDMWYYKLLTRAAKERKISNNMKQIIKTHFAIATTKRDQSARKNKCKDFIPVFSVFFFGGKYLNETWGFLNNDVMEIWRLLQMNFRTNNLIK